MIIECEKCHTKFNLDENLLKETGSKVRCSICKYIFTAFPPEAEPDIEEVSTSKVEETMIMSPEDIPREDEVEPISIEDLPDFEEGPVEIEEEEKVDIDKAMDRATRVEEEIMAQKEVKSAEKAEEPVKPRPIVKKKRRSGLLITILLIILLLAGAVAALIFFKPDFLPEYIPFLKKPVSKEQAFDMGNKRLSFKGLNSFFVNSEKAGKLFVVKGLVTNEYPDKRSFIRIKSNILNSQGKVVKNKIAHAGNPLSDKELQTLSVEEINSRQSNRFGKNNMNINILSNSSIPFMIIFSDLPENISEFTVEAISSSPAKK